MAGVKGNRRTVYSKMVIKESLIKLLQEKDIHNITVTDICKEADINRGTFYNYYSDPFDLLQSIENELFDKIVEYLNKDYLKENRITVLTKVFELAKENEALCKILLLNQSDSKILNRILYLVTCNDLLFMETNIKEIDKNYLNYIMKFIITGCIGIIQSWLENGLKESPIEMAYIIDGLTSKILGKH